METTNDRAHPEWPARTGVHVGCDDRNCTVCYLPDGRLHAGVEVPITTTGVY